jgi:hypothetical protein
MRETQPRSNALLLASSRSPQRLYRRDPLKNPPGSGTLHVQRAPPGFDGATSTGHRSRGDAPVLGLAMLSFIAWSCETQKAAEVKIRGRLRPEHQAVSACGVKHACRGYPLRRGPSARTEGAGRGAACSKRASGTCFRGAHRRALFTLRLRQGRACRAHGTFDMLGLELHSAGSLRCGPKRPRPTSGSTGTAAARVRAADSPADSPGCRWAPSNPPG